jgi:hypothetical protein
MEYKAHAIEFDLHIFLFSDLHIYVDPYPNASAMGGRQTGNDDPPLPGN